MPRTRIAACSTEHDAALDPRQIGARIRRRDKRASLTQQQLAGDRYTKAYVSALETGITRPSMVALNYLAETPRPAGRATSSTSRTRPGAASRST